LAFGAFPVKKTKCILLLKDNEKHSKYRMLLGSPFSVDKTPCTNGKEEEQRCSRQPRYAGVYTQEATKDI
jgi:hypothetical protein